MEKRAILTQIIGVEGIGYILEEPVNLFGLVAWKTHREIAQSLGSFFKLSETSHFSQFEQDLLVEAFERVGRFGFVSQQTLQQSIQEENLSIASIEHIFPQHCIDIVFYKNWAIACNTSANPTSTLHFIPSDEESIEAILKKTL